MSSNAPTPPPPPVLPDDGVALAPHLVQRISFLSNRMRKDPQEIVNAVLSIGFHAIDRRTMDDVVAEFSAEFTAAKSAKMPDPEKKAPDPDDQVEETAEQRFERMRRNRALARGEDPDAPPACNLGIQGCVTVHGDQAEKEPGLDERHLDLLAQKAAGK
ncbi:MAG TPA: hypothetical protein PLB01_00215 [Thermoanaerobaculia bacterium]|nr:hypothetical protein [Thermoanaerobaculia bacterium]